MSRHPNGSFVRPPDLSALGRPKPPRPPDPARSASRLASLIVSDPRGTRRVAADAGLDRRQLQRLVSGERDAMLLSSAARILAALGLSWGDLDE